MSDKFLDKSYWTNPYNQITNNDLTRIRDGNNLNNAEIASVNQVQAALNNQVRVSGDLSQARAKVEGWNTGFEQNQRPILSETTLDLVSTRYPFFKKSYVSVDSRLRDLTSYLRPNQYSIYLNNDFQNVQEIRLIDFETLAPVPSISGGNQQISWAFVPDYNEVSLNFFVQQLNPPVTQDIVYGDYYQVQIPEGFYSMTELQHTLTTNMNKVIRRPTTLDNTLFFNSSYLSYQNYFNLPQPTIWTRDLNTSSQGDEVATKSYRPMFHMRITPESGEVVFTCRSEERKISELRTEDGRPWIQLQLSNREGDNPISLSVKSIELTNYGSGYTIAPVVAFEGGGDPVVPAEAVAELSLGYIHQFIPINKGSGYTTNPVVTINPGTSVVSIPAVAQAFVSIIKEISLTTAGYGYGYGSSPNYILTTLLNQPADGSGCSLSLNLSGTQVIQVGIINHGSLYLTGIYNILFSSSQPAGTNISGGEDPFHARATATITAGAITGTTMTWNGIGYTSDVEVLIIGDGLGATATANVVNGEISSLTITNPGAGYTTADIYFKGGSVDAYAVATASVPGEVELIEVVNRGEGYNDTTTCTIAAPGGLGTTATYDVLVLPVGHLAGVTLTTNGYGYTSTPEVKFYSATGSGATAKLTMEYDNLYQQETNLLFTDPVMSVIQIVIPPGKNGSGYDPLNPPNVYIVGGDSSINATATAVVSDNTSDGTYGQVSYIAVNNGGAGYLWEPRVIIDPPPGVGTLAEAYAIMSNAFGPPVILTGWRESEINIGGFQYEWVEEIEFFPFYVLKGANQDTFNPAPSVNNILVPVIAPVYQIAGTTDTKNQRDPFDWDYPNVSYVPGKEYTRSQVLSGNWIRIPGCYRLHTLVYNNEQNIFTFGVANRSEIIIDDSVSAHNGVFNKLKIGRGMPFKWITTPQDLNMSSEGGCSPMTGSSVNTNINLDGSVASILPKLGFSITGGQGNASGFTGLSPWRCVWANYSDYLAPSLQTIIAINNIILNNQPINFIPGTPYAAIPNSAIIPNRYPLVQWPDFVVSNGGYYLVIGESYYFLRLKIPEMTSQPLSQSFFIATSNRSDSLIGTSDIYVNPVSLNESVLLNEGNSSNKTETGNPEIIRHEPLISTTIRKDFSGIFAKVRIPMGRVQGSPEVLKFSVSYMDNLIRNMDRIIVEIVDYQGRLVDLRCNHSFILEIYERKDMIKETNISTQIGDVISGGGATRSVPSFNN